MNEAGKEKVKIAVIVLLDLLLLVGCGQANQNNREAVYMNITAHEAKQIMDGEVRKKRR